MRRFIFCVVQLIIGNLGYMKFVDCYRPHFLKKANLIASSRCFAEGNLISGEGMEIIPKIDESGSSQVANLQQDLSNVKAVRYFINLTNGIEALAVLLRQGVPIENINVSCNAPPVAHSLQNFSFQQSLKSI
jgi:hypothetical protein